MMHVSCIIFDRGVSFLDCTNPREIRTNKNKQRILVNFSISKNSMALDCTNKTNKQRILVNFSISKNSMAREIRLKKLNVSPTLYCNILPLTVYFIGKLMY